MSEIILGTERLTLRYPELADVEFMVKMWTDAEMTRYTGGPRERSFLEREFENAASPEKREEYDLWTIELKTEGVIVGSAGFIPKEIQGRAYIELNYYIDREYQGKGYAREIASALIDYGFMAKRLEEIVAIVDEGNEASIKVAEAVGMRSWTRESRSGTMKLVYRIARGDAARRDA